MSIIDKSNSTQSGRLYSAFQHFSRMVRNHTAEELSALTNAILGRVFLVSITLEHDDNPYAIFESLNAKGQPLSQADLVRNFFFMSISTERHEDIYRNKWIPMEKTIGRENMESYIRHFLIREGSFVKESDVYYTLKNRIEERGMNEAETMLDELCGVADHYACLLDPAREPCPDVRLRLRRLQRLRATVCYPFLLKLFEDRAAHRIDNPSAVTILDAIENFIVRRNVCGTIRAELNNLFTSLYRSASAFSRLTDGVREILGSRNYPTDSEFSDSLQARKLYGGKTNEPIRLILERLEMHRSSKEHLTLDDLTIEHVMPQALTSWWQTHLGDASEETHQIYLHTIGNLTLTGYNHELSNSDFFKKRELLRESRIFLNQDIAACEVWTRNEIEARARCLADLALVVWPDFAPHAAARRATVRGTTPRKLWVMGQSFSVDSWQEVLRVTLGQIGELGDDVLERIAEELPRYVNRSQANMRSPRHLQNGFYCEGHLNAEQIHRLCSQFAQIAGLGASEYHVDAV